MSDLNDAWHAQRSRRWTRENAHLYLRPDAERFFKPTARLSVRGATQGLRLCRYERPASAERKYSPDQPRVPAGNPDGGQWTDVQDSGVRINDPRIISDETPDPPPKPGTQFAQNRYGRGPTGMSPGQAARLTAAQATADAAIARVRELDPQWRSTPSLYETAEGKIQSLQAEAREAQDRLSELGRNGIGPGPFAKGSIPARGIDRHFSAEEIRLNNQNGRESGCHTCGTRNPGTPSRNFVLDHQPPTAWNPLGRPQRLFPQCVSCSSRQGNWVYRNGGRR